MRVLDAPEDDQEHFQMNTMSEFLPSDKINDLVDFMNERRAYISGLIDGDLTIRSPLPAFNAYARSPPCFAAVSGSASLGQTQSVLVNGQLATLDQTSGVWELGPVGNANVSTLVCPGSNWQYLDAGNGLGSMIVEGLSASLSNNFGRIALKSGKQLIMQTTRNKE